MITVGQPQHLGRKTFFLFLSRRTTVALVLFIIAIIIFVLGGNIATGIAGLTSFGGPISSVTVANISGSLTGLGILILLLAVIAFLLGFIISLLQYRSYVFILDEYGIKMRRGVISQKEISLPYRQIQDVDIVRDVNHRIFGVSKLVMMTAGHEDKGEESDGTDTVFDPIDQSLAEEVRAFLERRIGVQIVEGEKEADTEEKVEEKKEDQA